MFDQIIQDIIKAAAAALAPLLVAIALKYLQKIHLSVGAEEQARLELYARQGIIKAAEYAASELKQKQEIVTSAEKLDVAVAHVQEALPAVSTAVATSAVHAQLPQMNEGATIPKPQA